MICRMRFVQSFLNRGIYKTVSTILTQVVVDPYDEAFYKPSKIIGRVMTEEEAEAEEKKGNHVTKVGRRLPPYRGSTEAGGYCGDGCDPRADRCGSDCCCLWRRRYPGSFSGQSFKGSKCGDREGSGSRKARAELWRQICS